MLSLKSCEDSEVEVTRQWSLPSPSTSAAHKPKTTDTANVAKLASKVSMRNAIWLIYKSLFRIICPCSFQIPGAVGILPDQAKITKRANANAAPLQEFAKSRRVKTSQTARKLSDARSESGCSSSSEVRTYSKEDFLNIVKNDAKTFGFCQVVPDFLMLTSEMKCHLGAGERVSSDVDPLEVLKREFVVLPLRTRTDDTIADDWYLVNNLKSCLYKLWKSRKTKWLAIEFSFSL